MQYNHSVKRSFQPEPYILPLLEYLNKFLFKDFSGHNNRAPYNGFRAVRKNSKQWSHSVVAFWLCANSPNPSGIFEAKLAIGDGITGLSNITISLFFAETAAPMSIHKQQEVGIWTSFVEKMASVD
ncbi:hypothetical protein B0H13DRAFT_1867668 [Mycena leptocephala]|nr:hypothetical protein B0H13DRAFT_1867668 [Mycena leptocephala]